jgi:SAM-dependent methyltransferase
MVIILILALTIAAVFGITALSGAPWVPLRRKDLSPLLADLHLKPGKLFVELGSGDGRFLKAASRTGAHVVGYELNPLLWAVSYARLLTTPNAKVYLRNFWNCPLGRADAVMAFLVPRTMPRLAKKLDNELKPGSLFASYIFNLPGKKPLKKAKSWQIYKF